MQDNRTREEMKQVKKLNRSLVSAPLKVQHLLGVMAIQPEKNVFFLGNRVYVKIYAIKAVSWTDVIVSEFIDMLCCQPQFRFRMTFLCPGENDTDAGKILRFLSVYAFCPDFAAADKQFSYLQDSLGSAVEESGNISVEECTIDHAMMFIYMNFTGQLRKFDREKLLGRKGNLPDELCLKDEKARCCFLGKEYPWEINAFKEKLLNIGCALQICIDIQGLDGDDRRLLDYIVGQKYHTDVGETMGGTEIVNLTYMLVLTGAEKSDVYKASEDVKVSARKNHMLLSYDSGMQERIYMSMCTFGLRDFHAMRNVSKDVIKNLVI